MGVEMDTSATISTPLTASRLAQEEAQRTQQEMAEKQQKAYQFKVAMHERLATYASQAEASDDCLKPEA